MSVSYTHLDVYKRQERERVDNYSEYLPYTETDVAAVVDELVTYLTVTENTEGEITIPMSTGILK